MALCVRPLFLLIISNRSRSGFVNFNLGAHFLDLRRLLFKLGGQNFHPLLSGCYGSGAPGRKFFEDIAATPELLSPSKCPGAEPGTHCSSSFGSANQKTTWFSSIRTPVMLLKAKASSMMASTRTCPMPTAFVVKSPIY